MDYQNAVSDRLIILLRSSGTSLLISSKHAQPKFYLSHCEAVDQDELSALLSTSIFAQTTVVVCNGPFTLCPAEAKAEEKKAQLTLLTGAQEQIHTAPFSEGIEQVFSLPNELPAWWSFLVNPEFTTELGMSHMYKSGGHFRNAIFFSVLEDWLSLRIYSGDRLVLANRYPAGNEDELFYFVLNAVEQLKLDLAATHVEYIGADQQFPAYVQLFQNYLPHLLHLPLLDNGGEDLVNQAEFKDDWLARISMQCVS